MLQYSECFYYFLPFQANEKASSLQRELESSKIELVQTREQLAVTRKQYEDLEANIAMNQEGQIKKITEIQKEMEGKLNAMAEERNLVQSRLKTQLAEEVISSLVAKKKKRNLVGFIGSLKTVDL